jgi:alkanesulfonate monooxygenase SsuD/methylene tetrahydromethanopterin reductase-like flavin-dependent oxidoreductase (luciferase family)
VTAATGRRYRVGAVVEQQALPAAEVCERAVLAEKLGMESLWMVQLPNQRDIATMLAGLATCTRSATIGAAILPVYTRPAVTMAHTAMTLDELSGGRFILGLGLGHRGIGEWMFGMGAAPPAVASMREYLGIVTGLVRDGEVSSDGTWFSGHSSCPDMRRPGMPIYLGAFGPRMLELAGELADGAILWMCSPQYVREHAMPALRRGWARRPGGADGFEVVAVLNAAVTDHPADDIEGFRRYLNMFLRVSTYRTLFEASGYGDCVKAGVPSNAMISDLAAIGPPELIAERLAAYVSAGATEVAVAPTVTVHQSQDRFAETLAGGLA